jgi:hypothetical protein
MIRPSLILSLLTAMLASEHSDGANRASASRTAPAAQRTLEAPLEECAMEKQQAIEEARRHVGNELNGL